MSENLKPKPKNALVVQIPLGDLHPSPTNRPERSGFDEKSIAELAESERVQGIIEPLIVRKHPRGKGYEIVCGERRWAAAKLIKLATAPCIERELDDNQARKIQIIENLQREGLHPVEEARGYADLLAQRDSKGQPLNTFESIAKDIGKSPAFVYGRTKLLKMPNVALQASFMDKLVPSNALLIARIPDPKLAYKAALEVLDPYGTGSGPEREKRALDPEIEPMSYRKAKDHIQTNYMVRLKGAPFDQEDAELVPVKVEDGERKCGGKCSDCPFRTGNLQALFCDVASADVCTNTACFKAKKEASWRKANQKAKAQGHTLLRDGKASQLFRNGELSSYQHDYVDARGTFPGEKKKTWEQVLGEHLPDDLVQARDDHKKLHFLIPVPAAAEAAKKVGRTLPKEFLNGDNRHQRYDPEEAKRQEAERARQRQRAEFIALALAKEVMAKAEAAPTPGWWRWILMSLLDGNEHVWAARFGCKNNAALAELIEKANEGKCRAMLVAVATFGQIVNWQNELSEGLIDACEYYKIDHKKIITDKKSEFRIEDKAAAELAKLKKAEAQAKVDELATK
jgi:ParB/RepB/Spo0J family partition protein